MWKKRDFSGILGEGMEEKNSDFLDFDIDFFCKRLGKNEKITAHKIWERLAKNS